MAGTSQYGVLADAISMLDDSASVPATTTCVPAAHRTEKVEEADETVCKPRWHSYQLAFSQPFTLTCTCITQLSDIYTILEIVALAEFLCPNSC